MGLERDFPGFGRESRVRRRTYSSDLSSNAFVTAPPKFPVAPAMATLIFAAIFAVMNLDRERDREMVMMVIMMI